MSTRLHDLFHLGGQSPWLDNLQRSYLTDGTLQQLVQQGVRGLTSNPSIFQKSIQGSQDYDEQFSQLISRGLTIYDAYWEMVLTDIHGALDIFEDVYRTSNGTDGFVSVEVDPSLARNGEGTLTAARELHERIGRPNVMIKIPGTKEGLPAIRQMISEGRSVNVTLIFSLDAYADVIEAYIAGLEDRKKKDLPLNDVQSVASFFISRVDNDIDVLLEQHATPDALALRGTVAIHQARLAYDIFSKAFSGARWEALAQLGASVQRPLWASTSTKNPAYPDTLYVDQLIGPHTVNTLPEATLHAFVDHGVVGRTIDTDINASKSAWSALDRLGINVASVAKKLEDEGVAAFIKSFDDLIHTLTEKARNF